MSVSDFCTAKDALTDETKRRAAEAEDETLWSLLHDFPSGVRSDCFDSVRNQKESYSWRLAEVNAGRWFQTWLFTKATTALPSVIKFPPTRPLALTMLGEFGSDLLGCVGWDHLDIVGKAQRMKGRLARSFGMQDLTSRNFTCGGIFPNFDLLKD